MLFLDTTVLVGAADLSDECHADGAALLKDLASGRRGTALTSDFVLDEAVTILGKRRGIGAKAAALFAERVLESRLVRCLYVDADVLAASLARYPRYAGALSFTDTVSVVLMERQGCEVLASHDEGFDRVAGIRRETR